MDKTGKTVIGIIVAVLLAVGAFWAFKPASAPTGQDASKGPAFLVPGATLYDKKTGAVYGRIAEISPNYKTPAGKVEPGVQIEFPGKSTPPVWMSRDEANAKYEAKY